MHYRLRTLLIVLALGPPVLALGWSRYSAWSAERDRKAAIEAMEREGREAWAAVEAMGFIDLLNDPPERLDEYIKRMKRWWHSQPTMPKAYDLDCMEYPMFRFTIRDLLWLTVVVGMGVGSLVDHRSLLSKWTAEREARNEWIDEVRELRMRIYKLTGELPASGYRESSNAPVVRLPEKAAPENR